MIKNGIFGIKHVFYTVFRLQYRIPHNHLGIFPSKGLPKALTLATENISITIKQYDYEKDSYDTGRTDTDRHCR